MNARFGPKAAMCPLADHGDAFVSKGSSAIVTSLKQCLPGDLAGSAFSNSGMIFRPDLGQPNRFSKVRHYHHTA
jgi:hypothetical protein